MFEAWLDLGLRVHPRSRGAAEIKTIVSSNVLGPSPLTRGSRAVDQGHRAGAGSIPAHAGQPTTAARNNKAPWVHPRSRGAASPISATRSAVLGPSPLTRGSRWPSSGPLGLSGSIPAHAGQPRSAPDHPCGRRVHPRSRGAAISRCVSIISLRGPSPLTRGSLDFKPRPLMADGSIPAHAGQPLESVAGVLVTRVHPRSRGAAVDGFNSHTGYQGPSPLTRGSLKPCLCPVRGRGSIPAHAGQPPSVPRKSFLARVHPRSRGAAWAAAACRSVIAGPSPLTRGSQPGPLLFR